MTARVDQAALDIAALAAGCRSLDQLAVTASTCVACPDLVESRSRVVTGDFPLTARFLIVGEAPGANEDDAGHPFVGKGGQLLDRELATVGIARSTVAVANVCNCRPAANRTPTTVEARRCAGWLDRQVELLDPSLVVTLGRTPLTWALDAKVKLADVSGVVQEWRGRRLISSYHPSAAIRFGPNGAPLAALRTDLALAAAETAGWS